MLPSPQQGPAGVWPVMLTPFDDDLRVDGAALDSLTDWYLAAGAQGLFAVCLSGEMYHLSPEERLSVAERVVTRSAGRAPVVASGTFGGPIAQQAEFVRRMADTGVTAVVVIAAQLAEPSESESVWRDRASRLLDLTAGVPLGLYECPAPYHRLLSAEVLQWAGQTGRFLFHKDTSCRIGPIRAKVEALRGSPLRFLNAHTPTLLPSLEAGGHGYCGTAANCYPELLVWLCRNHAAQPDRALRLQRLLSVCDRAVAHQYPAVVKEHLRSLGLPMGIRSRSSDAVLQEPDHTVLRDLQALVAEQCADLGILPAARLP